VTLVCLCPDEFEDEGVPEKSVAKPAHAKSDISTAGETSTVKEPRKESRKISLSALESRKRTREEEEYIPQPVSVNFLQIISWLYFYALAVSDTIYFSA